MITPQNTKSPPVSPLLVLGFGVLAISSSAILARLAQGEGVPSPVIAAWRLALASLVLIPQAAWRRRAELGALSRRAGGLALLSGGLLAVHFASWIASLAYTSVASSTVLVTTSPLWVGLLSPLLLGERLTRRLRIGLALALAGSALIALVDVVGWENGRFFLLTPTAASANAARPLLGNGLALLGALSAAGYLIIGRRLRPTLSLLSYTSLVYGTAALFLLLAVALSPAHGMGGYSPRAYLFLALLALFPQLIGHSSYNWALGYLPAAYVAIAVISEPVGATLLALFIFGEIPGTLTLLGGVLILGGVYYAGR